MEFCQLWLTCKDAEEADKISGTLLKKRLIACAKKTTVASNFNWKGKSEASSEVMLVMDSNLELFNAVESEVAKLHSYETFVLQATPVIKTSISASKWLKDSL